MRKIVINISVFVFTVFLFSCKKWLDLKPEDGIIKEEFWKTKEQVNAAVLGIYAGMMEGSSGSYGSAGYVPSLSELFFNIIIQLKTRNNPLSQHIVYCLISHSNRIIYPAEESLHI